MDGSVGSRLEGYLIALLAVAVAAIATALLWPLSEAAPFAFFYAAVAVAASRGGAGPRLTAMLGSALVGAYFFLPPHGSFQLTLRSASPILVFLGVSTLVGWLIASRRAPQTEERARRLWFEDFVEHIAEGVATTDAEGRITHLNPISERLSGCSLSEARGKPLGEVFRIFDERTRERLDPVAEVLAAGGKSQPPLDALLISPNGVEIPVSHAAAPMRGTFGALSGVVMIIRDVPQRKRTEEAPRKSEELNRKIIDISDDCLKVLDLDGRILMINEYGARLLEIDDRDCWEGRDMAEGWPRESQDTVREALRRAARGERARFGGFCPTAKGAPKWWDVSVAPIFGEGGAPERLLCISRDVTERKRVEDTLRESEERYRALFNSIDEGFFVEEISFDDQGRPADLRILEINPAFEALTGRGAEALGRTFRELGSGVEEHWLEVHARVALTGEPARFALLAPSARGRWYEVYAFRVGGEADRKVAVLFRNITEVVLAERERSRLVRGLEHQRADLAQLIERAPAFMCVLRGPNHVYELVNAEYQKLLGGRDYIGRPLAEVVPELESQGYFEVLDRVYQTGEPFVGREMVGYLDREGDGELTKHFANFVFQALRDPDGAITGIFVHGVDITEWKRNEDALRAGEERYRALFNSIDEGFCVVEVIFDDLARPINHRFLQVNPAFEDLTGLSDVVGRTMLDLDPCHKRYWFEILGQVALTGEPARFSNLIPTLGERWFSLHAFRVGGDDSRRVAILFTSITEAVLSERERGRLVRRLEHQRAELARLVEEAPAFICVLSGPNHVVELINAKFYELGGRHDVVGHTAIEAAPELESQGYLRILDQVYQTGETFVGREMPVYFDPESNGEQNRRVVNFVCQAMRDPDGAIRGVFVHGVDITDTVEAAESVKESEARYRELADAMPQAVWTCRPDGLPDFCNRNMREYAGFTEPEVSRESWLSVIHPDDLEGLKDAWIRSIRSREPLETEFRFKRASDGEYRWHLSRALPVRDENGHIVRWIGTNTDIHDFKLLSEALRQADRRKDEFLATLAHELRNPLAPIRTGLQILGMKPKEDMLASTVEMMTRQLGHMTRLIDDLLDVARVGRGKVNLRKERVALRSIIESGLEGSREAIGAREHALAVRIADEPIYLEADPTRIGQVVSNLLINAAKYTEPGGRIEISAQREEDEAVIRVKDTGAGLQPEMLEKVFEMFSQVGSSISNSQGGLGIGLTVVKRLVELHGGRIEARSRGLGFGSEFIVHLPIAADGDEPENQAARPPDASAKEQLRVLVVDDNRDSADTLAKVVAMAGHDVRTAYDGNQALAEAESRPPDLVLLDIGLPGLNGYEVAERIRRNPALRETRLIAVTGWGQAEDRRRSREAGFDLHFVKPVDLVLLQTLLESGVDAVRRALGEPDPSEPLQNGQEPGAGVPHPPSMSD